jgi:hypothetical protein
MIMRCSRRHGSVRRFSFAAPVLVCGALLQPSLLSAEQVPVRHMEGLMHGFLTLRTIDGKRLADGNMTQVTKGDRVTSHLTFRFKDGSIYDDTTEFSEHGVFRLLADHLVEQGPAFSQPMDTSLDATTGHITVRYSNKNGEEAVLDERQNLPPDLANGLLLTLVKDIQPSAPKTTVSLVVTTPKPRFVELQIVPQGEEAIKSGDISHQTVRYDVKVKIPGITGALTHLLGKQPPDIHIWVLTGIAPAFVKWEGPLYEGGPIWVVELAIPADFSVQN